MVNNRIGGGFTESELQFAGFWVRYRALLRQIGYGLLIAVGALTWGYALWGLLDAYAISYPRESRLTAEIAQNQFLAAQFLANRPQGIETGSVLVFQSTEERLDFLIPITNPNKDWWAEFTYRFNVSGELTPERSGFILPTAQSYLGEFGFKPETRGARSGALTVNNIRWHRLDPSVVGGDYAAWESRRAKFEAREVSFNPNLEVSGKPLSRTRFTLVNPTAYGYWAVKLYVVLKRAASPIAATAITLERVKPQESRVIELDWFERLPAISETEVVPVVNILDPSVYLPTTQVRS